MIIARVETGNHLFPGNNSYKKALEFIKKAITENYDNGRYEIDGDKIYARVMEYDLKDRDIAKYEAHKDYVDIQATMIGAEGMEVFFLDNQNPKIPYNEAKDVTIYENDIDNIVRINVFPGSFAMFFPNDVHKPQLKVDNIEHVKKLVVKIKVSEFY